MPWSMELIPNPFDVVGRQRETYKKRSKVAAGAAAAAAVVVFSHCLEIIIRWGKEYFNHFEKNSIIPFFKFPSINLYIKARCIASLQQDTISFFKKCYMFECLLRRSGAVGVTAPNLWCPFAQSNPLIPRNNCCLASIQFLKKHRTDGVNFKTNRNRTS